MKYGQFMTSSTVWRSEEELTPGSGYRICSKKTIAWVDQKKSSTTYRVVARAFCPPWSRNSSASKAWPKKPPKCLTSSASRTTSWRWLSVAARLTWSYSLCCASSPSPSYTSSSPTSSPCSFHRRHQCRLQATNLAKSIEKKLMLKN